MKLFREKGCTNQILQINITNMSSPVGSGLTGLTSGSAGLTCYYNRDNDASPTNIPLRAMTAGTFKASGIIEIDAVKMPGGYQFCPPDECFTNNSNSCFIKLHGAANMPPVDIEIDLGFVPANSGAIADKILGRNLAGGSDGGRTVQQALYPLRNKWTANTGVYTVYGVDDTTVSWTSTISSDAAANPIIGNDPA